MTEPTTAIIATVEVTIETPAATWPYPRDTTTVANTLAAELRDACRTGGQGSYVGVEVKSVKTVETAAR